MAKRYKPSPRAICKLGTIAHNRPFTTRELREYTGEGDKFMRWLKKHKLVQPVAAFENRHRGMAVYPTSKGWNMIEKACKR